MFVPGTALQNKDLWSKDIAFLESQGVPVKPFAKKAIERQSVCYFNNTYYNSHQKNVRFNKKNFKNVEEIVNEYKLKPEEELNYSGSETKTYMTSSIQSEKF